MKTRNHSTWMDFGIAADGFLSGVLVGVGLAAIFDPGHGARRRSIAAEKLRKYARVARDTVVHQGTDFSNRARGVIHETQNRFQNGEEIVPDQKLEQRVRSRMGHVVSHPKAIDVAAADGCVFLTGQVLEHEVDDLLDTVSSTPGVLSVECDFETYEDGSHIPSLQGESRTEGTDGRGAAGMTALGLLAGGFALYGLTRALGVDWRDLADRGRDAIRRNNSDSVEEEEVSVACPPGFSSVTTESLILDRVR